MTNDKKARWILAYARMTVKDVIPNPLIKQMLYLNGDDIILIKFLCERNCKIR